MPADLFLRLFLIIIYSLLNSRRAEADTKRQGNSLFAVPGIFIGDVIGIADCAIPHFLFNKLKPVFISGMNVGNRTHNWRQRLTEHARKTARPFLVCRRGLTPFVIQFQREC